MAYEEVTIVVGPYVQIRMGKAVSICGYTYTRLIYKPDDSGAAPGSGGGGSADSGDGTDGGGGADGGGDEEKYEKKRSALLHAADKGYKADPGNCVGSVKTAAKALGILELERLGNANNVIKHITKAWSPLSADEAQKKANAGEFAVAAQPSQEGQKSGHIMVVIPGKLKKLRDGKQYPMVQGGGSQGGRSPSAGGQLRCSGECWKSKHRDGIRYWTPKR